MEINLERNILKYKLILFFKSLMFFIPIHFLFFQSRTLSMTEILLIQSICSIFIIVMEVPTGILADKFGHKNSISVSLLLVSMGGFMYFLSYSFVFFLIAELLMSLGFVFFSGSSDSFLHSTLKKLNKDKDFKKISGSAINYSMFGYLISSLIGGYLAEVFSMDFVVIITAIAFFISFLISLSLKNPQIEEEKKEKKSSIQIFNESRKIFLENKKILWFFFFYSIFFTTVMLIEWIYQPFLQLINLDIKYFGWVYALMALIAMPISHFTQNIEKNLGFKKSIFLAYSSIFIILILLFFINSYIGILFLVLVSPIKVFFKIISTDLILKNVSKDISATVLSFFSMGKSFMYAIFAPILGYIYDIYGLKEFFIIEMVIIGFSLIFFFILFKIKRINF